jgi:hypothetical protein
MSASHLEFLVEEPSMEAFLRALLPRILPEGRSFQIFPFQGKDDLMGKLRDRLRGYAHWLPADWRIVVIVDRDDSDCIALKQKLEQIAGEAGLVTRAQAAQWQLVNRIAIEELEAWYFGDWEAVRAAYPRVSAAIPGKERFRDPDGIRGGTWEAFEQVLKRHGYFETGLRKVEAARTVGALLEPDRCRSLSFSAFYEAIAEATA